MTGTELFNNYLGKSTPNITTAGGISVMRPRQTKIASTAMLAVTLAFSASYADTLPSKSYDNQSPSNVKRIAASSQVDRYVYIKPSEVSLFIKNKEEIQYCLDSLPNLIHGIFGKSQITLSIYKDYEEGWENLLVSIEPVNVLKNTNKLEKKFFAEIDKDDTLISALEHITISCDYQNV